jgi:hypothetical protein
VNLRGLRLLDRFGNTEELHAAMDQVFLLCEPKSGEGDTAVDGEAHDHGECNRTVSSTTA